MKVPQYMIICTALLFSCISCLQAMQSQNVPMSGTLQNLLYLLKNVATFTDDDRELVIDKTVELNSEDFQKFLTFVERMKKEAEEDYNNLNTNCLNPEEISLKRATLSKIYETLTKKAPKQELSVERHESNTNDQSETNSNTNDQSETSCTIA